MPAIWRRVVWNIEDGRFRDAARLVVHEASEKWHEWRMGIDTSRYVPVEGLGFANPDANHYIATDYRGFRRVMDRLRISSISGRGWAARSSWRRRTRSGV